MAIIIIAMVIWKKQINSYLKHYKPSFPFGAMDVVHVFNYPELLTATKAFSEKIASGGVGTVFEGILSVAVKRLESFSSQGYKQFKAEESHYFLIYEYVANGSLDKWIYKPREELNWDTRFKIVEEIARGMCYLHEECSTRVLHLDIKPQNLLLDENFGVKIAEFGLSRMVEQGDLSDVMTMI
ncbi:G-type lectin S-receptor-like serine/threonine-protein kinase At5g24080 [Selaginella moellendorffii]|uniref:G-type lectin S-receptor-like serine/threonine-protein kinase At5g24080 n=1 Tax=Selaginella moellendorffii TaxID=88036 RepID=UPI000D1CADC3|nr:G-type lectin S-receptor-like serine/threonine-protein kinase At5g24080 [Selaginella moellendorffii]|eukprot:XP_024518398.1 G-type lectin S-receptor-like serine/threonine-protein kinase At5g24080 [Selaginella moellendorffii]